MAGLTDEIDRQRAEIERLTRERDEAQQATSAARHAGSVAAHARDRLRAALAEAAWIIRGKSESAQEWANRREAFESSIEEVLSAEPSSDETSDAHFHMLIKLYSDGSLHVVNVVPKGVAFTVVGRGLKVEDTGPGVYHGDDPSEKARGEHCMSHFPSNETLRRQILSDPDDEPSAGNVP